MDEKKLNQKLDEQLTQQKQMVDRAPEALSKITSLPGDMFRSYLGSRQEGLSETDSVKKAFGHLNPDNKEQAPDYDKLVLNGLNELGMDSETAKTVAAPVGFAIGMLEPSIANKAKSVKNSLNKVADKLPASLGSLKELELKLLNTKKQISPETMQRVQASITAQTPQNIAQALPNKYQTTTGNMIKKIEDKDNFGRVVSKAQELAIKKTGK